MALGATRMVAAVVGVGGAAQAMFGAVRSARAFGRSMAEVSTLLDNTNTIPRLSEDVRALAEQFGQAPVEEAKALYSVISAGFSETAESVGVLTAANKLAVGGVTDVATAATGLVSVLNAYGDEAGTVTDVSDALFVAMRAGQTTIPELANALGQVSPVAANAGVSLEEMLAAVSALTKGGQSTRIAVTGLRGILQAVLVPSKEASDAAERLGLNFSAAGIEADGFQGFLRRVTEATRGNTDVLADLFPGVEALVPILSLAGNQADDFAAILASMNERMGETERAVDKMVDTADMRLAQMQATLTNFGIDFGNEVLVRVIPAVEALNNNLKEVVGTLKALGLGLVALGLVKFTRIVWGLYAAWRAASFAFAATPWGAVIVGLTTGAALLYEYTINTGDAADATDELTGSLNRSIETTRALEAVTANSKIALNEAAVARYDAARRDLEELERQLSEFETRRNRRDRGAGSQRELNETGAILTDAEGREVMTYWTNLGLHTAESFYTAMAKRIREQRAVVQDALESLYREPKTFFSQGRPGSVSDVVTEEAESVIEALQKERAQIAMSARSKAVYSALMEAEIDLREESASRARVEAEAVATFNAKEQERLRDMRVELETRRDLIGIQGESERAVSVETAVLEAQMEALQGHNTLRQEEVALVRALAEAEFDLREAKGRATDARKDAQETERRLRSIQAETEYTRGLIEAEGMRAADKANYVAVLDAEREARVAGRTLTVEEREAVAALSEAQRELERTTRNAGAALDDFFANYRAESADFASIAVSSMEVFTRSTEDLLTDFFTGTQVDVRAWVSAMIKEIVRLAVVKPLIGNIFGAIGGDLGGLFGGGGGAASTATSGLTAVSRSQTLQAFTMGPHFSEGGVTSGPEMFRRGGEVGIRGESGPEGILPLAMVNGELGVRSTGGGGDFVYSPTINIEGVGGSPGGGRDGDPGQQRRMAARLDQGMRELVREVLREESRPGGMTSGQVPEF